MLVQAYSARIHHAVLVVRVTATESVYLSKADAVAIGPEPFTCIRDFWVNLVAPCRDFDPQPLGAHDHRSWVLCWSCGHASLLRRGA